MYKIAWYILEFLLWLIGRNHTKSNPILHFRKETMFSQSANEVHVQINILFQPQLFKVNLAMCTLFCCIMI